MNKSIIFVTAIAILFSTSEAFSKWNKIEQPYEGISIEVGDKTTKINNFAVFWSRFKSTDDKHLMLTQTVVDCSTNEYSQLFIENDKIIEPIKNRTIPLKLKDGDMFYYPIKHICKDIILSCKPDDTVNENLNRSFSDESWDILKNEIFISNGSEEIY
jgi:hypothetical protein